MSLVSVDILLATWHLCVPQKRELCAGWSNTVPMVLFRSTQFDFFFFTLENWASSDLFIFKLYVVMDCKSKLFALIGVFYPMTCLGSAGGFFV